MDHLLETAPERRPTAADALRHHWLTGERPSGAQAVQARARTEVEAEGEGEDDADDDDGATTTVSNADANGTTVQRVSGIEPALLNRVDRALPLLLKNPLWPILPVVRK